MVTFGQKVTPVVNKKALLVSTFLVYGFDCAVKKAEALCLPGLKDELIAMLELYDSKNVPVTTEALV